MSNDEADMAYRAPVAKSPAMLQVLREADKIAATDISVMILGQTGAGKGEVARYIHQHSVRHQKRLAVLDCGSIPENLIESDLFGHVKGAFTDAVENRAGKLQEADGGTLFLDEIGELPLRLQSRLLRVLDDGVFCQVGSVKEIRVDIRILAATNRSDTWLQNPQHFRQDLRHRLEVICLTVPPLSKRPEDIEALADHFLRNVIPVETHRTPPFTLSADALTWLKARRWKGNVRELRNSLTRAVIFAESGTTVITPDNFQREPQEVEVDAAPLGLADLEELLSRHWATETDSRTSFDRMVRMYSERIVASCGGNLQKAARRMGTNIQTLTKRTRR